MEDMTLQQHVASANVRGDVADLWAGPLSVAVGAEYRQDKIAVTHDALSNEYAYFQNFGSDYNGNTKVTEGYLEAELPLARDMAFARSLVLNGAVRYTHYDISGFGSYLRSNTETSFNATAWKASLVWDPVRMIRFRATQSRDIRAPNFADLFLASASAFTPVVNPFNTSQTTPPTIYSGGFPSLRPEKADTTTLGVVVSPSGFLDGLRLSVDWYRIKVKDYIGSVPGGAQFIVDRCFANVAAACAAIDFGPNNTISVIRNVSLNLDEIETSGIDIEAVYTIPLGGDRQAITLRGLATYVDKLKTVSFGDVVDRAGQTGNSAGLAAPRWTSNATITYDSPHFSTTLQGRFIASGLYDAQRVGPDDPAYATTRINSISDNRVASRFYVNLFATYRFSSAEGRGAELFAAVNNLFDRAPPAAPETQFYTNPVYFDTIGRYFRVGARYKY
jgi:outer membrane receptor protein involved in Fe transport